MAIHQNHAKGQLNLPFEDENRRCCLCLSVIIEKRLRPPYPSLQIAILKYPQGRASCSVDNFLMVFTGFLIG